MTDIATIGIKADTTDLKRGQRALGDFASTGENTEKRVNRSALSMARSIGVASAAAIGIGAALAFRAGFAGAQEIQSITNGFRGMGQSASEAAASLQAVAAIADRTRAPLGATAELYRRVSVAAGELGASQSQVGQFTQNIGMALAASGTSAAQASGALLQLSQAMAGGTVRAEEFNSILEGAFPIAQAAARGIEAAGGSVGKLRQLVVEGKVSSEEFFNAILSQSAAIKQAFGNTVPTIGQAMTDLSNATSLVAAQFDTSIGLSAGLAQAILAVSDGVTWLGQNSAMLVDGLQILGIGIAALAATALPSLAVATYGAVTAFAAGTTGAGILTGALGLLRGALMLAGGPWGILAGLIVAAAGYFLLFRDNASEATKAMDESRAMSGELNKALGNFYSTAAPSAASAAIGLANANYELANSAFEAARGELEKARSIEQANQIKFGSARNEDGSFIDPEASLLAGGIESEDMRRSNAALAEYEAALARLSTVENERRLATRAATGAMSEHFGETSNAVTDLTGEIAALGDVATGGGGGGALGGMTDGMKELEEATKAMNAALAPVESSAENAFVSFVTGAKDARGAVADLMGDLAKLAAQAAFRTLAGNLFTADGAIGSIFAGMFDSGGNIPAGQFGIVGERGPEIVQGPAMVTSRADTAKMLGSGGGASVSITINAQGAQEGVAAQIDAKIRAAIPEIAKAASSYGADRRSRGFAA